MKTLLVYFSDIHLTGAKPENEGTVIKAFCEDLKKQLLELKSGDVYALIGGDLRPEGTGQWHKIFNPSKNCLFINSVA